MLSSGNSKKKREHKQENIIKIKDIQKGMNRGKKLLNFYCYKGLTLSSRAHPAAKQAKLASLLYK